MHVKKSSSGKIIIPICIWIVRLSLQISKLDFAQFNVKTVETKNRHNALKHALCCYYQILFMC